MEFDEKDAEVIQLLTQLKNVEGGYPVEMMAVRRQRYMKQLAGLGVGLGAADALKHTLRGGGGSAIPPIASTLLETILIVAIVAEAAAVTLINREKLTDLILSISNQPTVEQVVSTPIEIAGPLTELAISTIVEPTVTVTTVTVTPLATSSPALLSITSVPGFENGGSTLQAVSTPNVQDNNGNQYGLTPKPERTKDPGGNDDDGDGGNEGSGQKPNKDTGKK
jgi:hypothetical protein